MSQRGQTTRTPRGPAYPDAVKREARTLYRLGHGPKEIASRIERTKARWDLDEAPGVSTIKSWVQGLTRGSTAPRWDPWSRWLLPDEHPQTDVSRRRIAMVAAWKAREAGRPDARWLTMDEALWVDRIASLLPDERPDVLYRSARTVLDLADDPAAVEAFELELVLRAANSDPTIKEVEETWPALGASRVLDAALAYDAYEGLAEHLAEFKAAVGLAEAEGIEYRRWPVTALLEWARKQGGRHGHEQTSGG